MAERLSSLTFGYALAVWSAAFMLIIGIFGNLGLYLGAVEMMEQWHMFFSLSVFGIIGGMIESAIISFVLGYSFVWLYNKFA